MTELLRVDDLSFATPDRRPLVSALSFVVRAGEILTICGPNGVGKSTLLHILSAHAPQQKGSVLWQVAASERVLLPQLHNRDFHIPMTLGDVLSFSGRRPEADAIERIGLLHRSDVQRAWNTASGGERQKTLLTRALLEEPRVLLLDEPLNHLDLASRLRLYEVLQSFVASSARAVIMVSHELHPEDDHATRHLNLKGYIAP